MSEPQPEDSGPSGGGELGGSGAPGMIPLPKPIPAAVAIGLMAGVAEAVLMVFASVVLGRYTRRDPQLVWAAPIAVALVCLVATLPLVPFAARATASRARAAVVGVAAFLGALEVTLIVYGLHPLARIILSAGVGVQARAIAIRFPRAAQAILRTGGRTAAVLTVLAFVALYGSIHLHERRMMASLGAARPGAPNILLLILDTMRASEMSLYGARRPTTPRLTAVAREGVVFDRAYSPSSWTLPSHASFFTGHHAHELTADWLTPFQRDLPTLSEILGAQGYVTAGFVGNLMYASRESGLARGLGHYVDYPLVPSILVTRSRLFAGLLHWYSERRGTPIPSAQYRAPAITNDLVRWLPRTFGRPWFAFVNLFDAHDPYQPPPELVTRFRTPGAGARNPFLHNEQPVSVTEATGERDAYAAGVAAQDAHLGAMLDSLRAHGALDNTIVVVVGDHGEQFGEHGLLGHGNSLYAASLHVPLIVVWPGHVPGGVRVAGAVSARDVAATIMNLSGAGDALPGRTLARHWDGRAAAPDTVLFSVRPPRGMPAWHPTGRDSLAGVIIGRYQLIRSSSGHEQIFDLVTDPLGLRPLDPSTVPDLAVLRSAIPANALRP